MKKLSISVLAIVASTSWAAAQVPVYDGANHAKAQEIANTTQKILDTDKEIMEFTNKTLQAVTGDRSSETGQLAQMALGNGFSMGQAPSLGSILSGGSLSFAGMGGGAQDIVSKMIQGLQLVQSLSGLINGESTSYDKAYQNSVNMAATVTGLVDSTQGAVTTRGQAFTQGASQIGQAKDLKGSIDQNSQISVQTGATVNELIGVMNTAVAATNQENIDRVTLQSQAANALKLD